MAIQLIDEHPTYRRDGTGDSLEKAFNKCNDNFIELYGKTQGVVSVAGGTADDTTALSAAITEAVAANAIVLADADEYNINPTTLGVITDGVSIRFGRNTVINNLQTSGTKLATLRFAGTGLTGSAVTVSAIESSYLKNEITVSDASGFAVGDTVLLSENEATQATTQYDSSPNNQDFNYREYLTIAAINGNDIEFEEFIRFPHDTANTLRLQKVEFLENVHVSGGTFSGANATGGGVEMKFCRNSTVKDLRCIGNSDSDKNGNAALITEDNWQCQFSGITAFHTLYLTTSRRNQSCLFTDLSGKRTLSGGVILNGERFCIYQGIVQDATGDDNGDSFQMGNGCRHNLLSDLVVHGASCYTLWMFQSCDNNKFANIKSIAGITAGFNIFGDNNEFRNCDITKHGGGGINDGGQNNRFTGMYIDVAGNGLFTKGSGTYFEGVCKTNPSGSLRDVQLSNATNTTIRTRGGTARGVNLSGTNTGYDIEHEGDLPYYSKRTIQGRGWSWSRTITGITNTPANVGLINDSNQIVDWVSRNSSSTGVAYKVTLKLNSGLAQTVSEYVVLDISSALTVHTIFEGSGTYAAYVPKLTVSSGNVQISTTNAGPLTAIMLVERF